MKVIQIAAGDGKLFCLTDNGDVLAATTIGSIESRPLRWQIILKGSPDGVLQGFFGKGGAVEVPNNQLQPTTV